MPSPSSNSLINQIWDRKLPGSQIEENYTGYHAALYDKLCAVADNRFDAYLNAFSAHHKILDLACGTGRFTEQASLRGHDVLGVDLAHQMIAHAQRRHHNTAWGTNCLGKVAFQTGDVLKLNFSSCFDGVALVGLTLSLFQSRLERQRVLAVAARATRPGGVVIVDYLPVTTSSRTDEYQVIPVAGAQVTGFTLVETHIDPSDRSQTAEMYTELADRTGRTVRRRSTTISHLLSTDEIVSDASALGLRLAAKPSDGAHRTVGAYLIFDRDNDLPEWRDNE